MTARPLRKKSSKTPNNFRRMEEKLRLSPAAALSLYDALSRHAAVDEFILGQPLTLMTTVYLDGPHLPLYQEARQGGTRTRLRLRRYAYESSVEPDPYAWL